MKKKLFIALGFIFGLGILGTSYHNSNVQYLRASAEEEIVEEIVENEPTLTETISQTAQDVIAVIKETLSQPIVIGGVSVSLGTLVLWVITKALGNSKGQVKDLTGQIKDILEKSKEYVSLKDFNSLIAQKEQIIAILNELLPTIKNIKAKENIEKMLIELGETVIEKISTDIEKEKTNENVF